MLKLCDVSMYYQNGTNVTVGIQKINLELRSREFVVITGESGSGKSTLLNVISSLAPYHDGEMLLDGEPTSGFDDRDWEDYRREHIGFIFQNYNLIESYTVLQNVVSAMLIMGVDPEEANERAMNYLERVGIAELAGRRASKLSAGQKQRLTIARALAKETDIIIADEPTGNLDSKNGRQIVELLASLAEDKLVVMVSHNIEEAEEFATRMIRLKDGRIVSDTVLRELAPSTKNQAIMNAGGGADVEPVSSNKPDSKTNSKTAAKVSRKSGQSHHDPSQLSRRKYPDWSLANRLAGYNSRFQPAKATLITLFLTAVCFAAFIFMGSLLSNIDDTPAKIYNTSAFLNGDNTRILIQHKDGSPITEKDLAYFASLPHVVSVDEYGYAGDCCYYYMEGYDYEIKYREYTNMDGPPDRDITPVLLKDINFIKTANRMSPSELSAGRLPENSNEIVLYSDDPSTLGQTMVMYFSDPAGWSKGSCVKLELTVVGLLKRETSQIYFHENIAKAFYISRTLDDKRLTTTYLAQYYEDFTKAEGQLPTNVTDVFGKDYLTRVFPDASLDESTILCTFIANADVPLEWFGQRICTGHVSPITGETVTAYTGLQRSDPMFYGVSLSFAGDKNITYDRLFEYEYDFENDIGYPKLEPQYEFMLFDNVHFVDTIEDGRIVGNSFSVIDDKSFNTFVDFFEIQSDQAAIYISDYAYVNDTLVALAKSEEYIGISPFMISSTSYDTQKVRERFAVLILSLIALVAVFVLEIIVLFTLMRLKRDDYAIFKSLGMTGKVMHRMNFIELLKYDLIALIASAVILGALWIFKVPPLNEFTVYYRWQHVLVIILCSIASTGLLGAFFNRYLDNQFNGKRISDENGR